jgi:hypothetical protein
MTGPVGKSYNEHPHHAPRRIGLDRPSARDTALLTYLTTHRHGEKYLLATQAAYTAEPLLRAKSEPILVMGGLHRQHPLPHRPATRHPHHRPPTSLRATHHPAPHHSRHHLGEVPLHPRPTRRLRPPERWQLRPLRLHPPQRGGAVSASDRGLRRPVDTALPRLSPADHAAVLVLQCGFVSCPVEGSASRRIQWLRQAAACVEKWSAGSARH